MFTNVRRVFGQLVFYGTGDVAVTVVNFLLLPLYTRVLTPVDYGALALLTMFEAFLKPVYRWGLDESFLRFYYEYHDDSDRRTLAGTIVLFLLVVDGVLLAALTIGAPAIAVRMLGSTQHLLAFRLMLFNSFVSGFHFLPFSILRIREKPVQFAGLTFARSFGTVLMRLVFVVAFRLGVLGIVLADVVVSIALLVGLTNVIRSMIGWRFSWNMGREVLRYGSPRVPHGILFQTMAMSDRFFLGLYLPLRDIGLYSIGISIASLLKFYTVSFMAAWLPFAYAEARRADAAEMFARMATYSFAVLVFLTLGISALAEGAVWLMLPATYRDAVRVVPLLSLGIAIQSAANFLTTSLNLAKRTRPYPIVTAAAATVSVLGNLVLIPRLGVIGASLAVVLGQLTLMLATAYFAQTSYRIPYEWGRLIKVSLVGLVLYALIPPISATALIARLAIRVALLAVFPICLIVLRFFRPSEVKQMAELLMTLRRGRAATAPASSGGGTGE